MAILALLIAGGMASGFDAVAASASTSPPTPYHTPLANTNTGRAHVVTGGVRHRRAPGWTRRHGRGWTKPGHGHTPSPGGSNHRGKGHGGKGHGGKGHGGKHHSGKAQGGKGRGGKGQGGKGQGGKGGKGGNGNGKLPYLNPVVTLSGLSPAPGGGGGTPPPSSSGSGSASSGRSSGPAPAATATPVPPSAPAAAPPPSPGAVPAPVSAASGARRIAPPQASATPVIPRILGAGGLDEPMELASGPWHGLSLQAVTHLTVPILFAAAVALFVLLQALVDRRDPKVSRAPERGDEETVGFK
jgi:hypothetical protein